MKVDTQCSTIRKPVENLTFQLSLGQSTNVACQTLLFISESLPMNNEGMLQSEPEH